jgi:hypothetical protein
MTAASPLQHGTGKPASTQLQKNNPPAYPQNYPYRSIALLSDDSNHAELCCLDYFFPRAILFDHWSASSRIAVNTLRPPFGARILPWQLATATVAEESRRRLRPRCDWRAGRAPEAQP